MKILALETATQACSAALYLDGELFEQRQQTPQAHSRLLLPMIDALMAQAQLQAEDLDAIAFGRGPGSFTGLRIAAAVTQGIAYAASIPVIPISTLAALALGAARTTGQDRFLVALDARMQEVYWACYQTYPRQAMQLVGEERLCLPQDVPLPTNGHWFGVGSGWMSYQDTLVAALKDRQISWDGTTLPWAAEIALLAVPKLEKGEVLSAEEALPVYLRDQVVQPPASKAT